jgi:hypothetical protein
MKTIMIQPNGIVSVKEISSINAVRAHFNGPIELVASLHLPSSFIMLVDEEGKINGLPKNDFGSSLYEADLHGDVFLMKIEQSPDTSYNVVGLTEQDIRHLAERFQLDFVPAAADA